MTDKEIEEGNKLIIEFMASMSNTLERELSDYLLANPLNGIRYYSDWNAIIKVIKVIEYIQIRPECHNNEKFLWWANKQDCTYIFNFSVTTSIDTIWKYCVGFIKIYNKTELRFIIK